MGWQWHQLDHVQIICTLLQTDNHTSTSSLNFLQAGCSSWCSTNSIKTLKAIGCRFVGLSTPASSVKHVDITEQIVAIYPQPWVGCKLEPTVNCKDCSDVYAYHCAQLLYIIQHRTILSLVTPFPQIDIIGVVVIVWRIRGKIIRSVLCNILCNICAQCNAHTYEQTNSSVDWVLSHWAHFTVLRFIFVYVLYVSLCACLAL